MVKRKDALRALLSGEGQSEAETPADERKAENRDAPPRQPQKSGTGEHVRSGAINAMRESWGELRREADAAKTMREEIASGGHVTLIDPERILPSPITDRLTRAGDQDNDFETLKASIETSGQAVPVLLRPHSDAGKSNDGYYETAYGHRRVRAAKELGLQVRAIIKPLSDEELILSQGRENAERRDLTFIERALFARTLGERGFSRETIRAALSIDNTQLTRLFQVAERVPETIVKRVGPAPKVGRPRWGDLGELIEKEGGREMATEFTERSSFAEINDSDTRFRELFKYMTVWNENRSRSGSVETSKATRTVSSIAGEPIAAIKNGVGGKTSMAFVGQQAGGFSAFLAERLPDLFEEFRAASAKDTAYGSGESNEEDA